MNEEFEITPDNIRHSWYGDSPIENKRLFLVMKNKVQWQGFWRTINPSASIPTWHKGDTGIFIFLGEQIPGGTYAQLTTLKHSANKHLTTLYWQRKTDPSNISMMAFQDIWAVFLLREGATPFTRQINHIIRIP